MSKIQHKDLSSEKTEKNIVLKCQNVFKEYVDADTRVKVLNDISLSVQQGEQIAIMGRSGAGKTTLLQVLGGLDIATAGEVWIVNQAVKKMSESRLERIRNQSLGFIYQMHHLLPEFTALENVAMPLLIGNISANIAKRRAAALLEQVGLQARLSHRPAELSGGERQRVAIARALVNDPSCVLADEPTGNLDDEHAGQVLEMMQALNRLKKTSLIIVTHDSKLASKTDRILILQGGHLLPA
jgi:lipoprotein-releasing system ATP-binding protein